MFNNKLLKKRLNTDNIFYFEKKLMKWVQQVQTLQFQPANNSFGKLAKIKIKMFSLV